MEGECITDQVVYNNTAVNERLQKKIETKDLLHDDFYIAETDEEREKNAETLSAAEIQEIRHRANQTLRRAPGAYYNIRMPHLSDWFQNKIPENQDLWPSNHPMSMEVRACIQPIVNAQTLMKIEEIQEMMQENGAFMVRVGENTTRPGDMWNTIFFLDSGLYAELEMYTPNGVPESIKEEIKKEIDRRNTFTNNSINLLDRNTRISLLQAREESILRDGEKTEEQSDEEAEEERMQEEEKNAKEALFKLQEASGYILNYNIYLAKV